MILFAISIIYVVVVETGRFHIHAGTGSCSNEKSCSVLLGRNISFENYVEHVSEGEFCHSFVDGGALLSNVVVD